MSYVSGFVCAVPDAKKQDYITHAKAAWPIFQQYGALRLVECWGDDVPHGKQTDFYRATQAQDDEVPVFSWIEWPDKATADTAFASMHENADMQALPEMPFDGTRMFWGGFAPVFDTRTG